MKKTKMKARKYTEDEIEERRIKNLEQVLSCAESECAFMYLCVNLRFTNNMCADDDSEPEDEENVHAKGPHVDDSDATEGDPDDRDDDGKSAYSSAKKESVKR